MSLRHDPPNSIPWAYDRAETIADGIVHVVGLMLGIAGAFIVISVAAKPVFYAAAAYAAGLVLMLACSAMYNMWPVSPLKWLFRRFDLSAIYLMIVGTYMPILAKIEGSATSRLLIVMWIAAAAGVLHQVLYPRRQERLSIIFYLLLGSCGLILHAPIVATLPETTCWLLLIGAVIYASGLIFHTWDGLRFQNAIWHCFVLAAAMCHYIAVIDLVA